MSPINKIKLKILRNKIDNVDNSLIKLIKQRTALVKKVIKIKETKKHIVDKPRIKKILKDIRNKSIKNNIDPKITKRIWSNMIYAYIDFEKKIFRKK